MSLFVVIEGLDGAGGETQTRRLIRFLKNNGKEVVALSYPNPESAIGKVIYSYLNKKIDIKPDIQMALYTTDFALDREKINAALQSGKAVVADRYFTTTLAYQCGAKGVPVEKALEFAKLMRLPVPDIVIYLDISPETSIKRKSGENKILDRHEEDKILLRKVKEAYQNLVKNKVFGEEWVVVNGEKSIEAVASEVQKIVLSKLK